MAIPGMLLVTMQPRPGLTLDAFHEWYNNEHGPARLRLPAIFSAAQRFKATDGREPTFLAAYDVRDMAALTTPVYTDLRANRSPREATVIGQIDVVRHLLVLQSSHAATTFVPVEHLDDSEAHGRVLVLVEIALADSTIGTDTEADAGTENEAAFVRWYEDDHLSMLARVPGWLRSRRYRTTSGGTSQRILCLHEFAAVNGLGGLEHRAALSTPTTGRAAGLINHATKGEHSRSFALIYVFGPAPRDLGHLARLPATQAFLSVDARTAATPPPPTASIRSYVTVPSDGLVLPYVLEGNPAPDAPTVAFCNSLLTSLDMWDRVVALLRSHRPHWRILRYDARGRGALPTPAVPATLEMLADDLHSLLGALRITRLHALVGVSLGGATALRFAQKYPDRVARFVACDCNLASSASNTKAWEERVALAKGTPDGMQRLATDTVRRWFHPDTMRKQAATVQAMEAMVAANDLAGFRYGCQALWTFDMCTSARACRVPGLLVAGERDGNGALPRAMNEFRHVIGQPDGSGPVPLRIVSGAGHLPMYEQPDAFWESVKDFL